MPPLITEEKRERTRRLSSLSTNAWEAVFANDHLSEAGQLRFLSRMCYITMSHYLLYRGVLPKDVFKRRKLEDLAIYCFDNNKRWGHKLSEMMKGIREAIEKKFVKQAFVMINEDQKNPDVATEVFSINFCYNKQHTLTVLDDKGNRIISMGYKGEKNFRLQVKHIIKKLSVVTKQLKPLAKSITPYMKLTYYDETPDDYEPLAFKHCDSTYTFKSKHTFYKFGDLANKETAMSFVLESSYITEEDVTRLDDLLFDQAGYKDNDDIDMLNVTADGFIFTPEKPLLHATPKTPTPAKSENIETARQDEEEKSPVPQLLHNSPMVTLDADESNDSEEFVVNKKVLRDSPYVKAHPKRSSRMNSPRMEFLRFASKRSVKSSVSSRSILKSPNDNGQ